MPKVPKAPQEIGEIERNKIFCQTLDGGQTEIMVILNYNPNRAGDLSRLNAMSEAYKDRRDKVLHTFSAVLDSDAGKYVITILMNPYVSQELQWVALDKLRQQLEPIAMTTLCIDCSSLITPKPIRSGGRSFRPNRSTDKRSRN